MMVAAAVCEEGAKMETGVERLAPGKAKIYVRF